MPSRMITTSWPISTSRLARSMASSATAVCSSDGRSKVEATTSPFTDRRMSVTSSGRSSTSSTMRWTSGLLASIEWAICFMTVVLPALGGETIRPRWPLPIGASRSTMRAVTFSLAPGISRSSLRVGEQRGEVLEAGPAAGLLGVEPGHRVDPQQRRVLLVVRRRAAGALDVVALAQREPPGLADRDVDVLGSTAGSPSQRRKP